MKAVIMAGGFGTRIHPLTINLPKPMIPLANRPILLHIIELLKKHGIDELVMLLYHQPEAVKNFFRDGSDFGVHITYITPLEDYGTAGAVKYASRHLDERFLVISGDLLTDFDLSAAIEFHERKQALATIALTPVKDPLQFGVVITDREGRITKFLEKPGWGEVFSDTINTGIYVLEPEVLELIPEQENRDWSKDIFTAMLAEGKPLYGCTMQGYWQDIGNTDAYLETCRDITSHRVSVNIEERRTSDDDREIFAGDEVLPGPSAPAGLAEMVVLGSNSQVLGDSKLKNCIVGRNCTIEEGAELEDAVLWDNVYVKKGSRITGAVVCSKARIGRGVTIEAGAVIGDETSVGDEALVRKNVKVWPRKEIEAGAIVNANLIWGEKWRKSLYEGAVVSGLTNVELSPEFVARLGAAYGSTLPKDAFILAGRDAIRASRMLKRSFVGGLLSAGINVHDCKMVPLPVLRYKLSTFGEVGGVHFRQAPTDPAATEILFYDAEGNELSSAAGKGIERIFFKENFRRVHYSEPGAIFDLPRLNDFYREGFLRALDTKAVQAQNPKVVVDLNHSPASDLLPALLNQLGCDVIELNSHVEEKSISHTPAMEERAMTQLSRIVSTLEADAGFWLGPSGETLGVVDEKGHVLSHLEALTTLTALAGHVESQGSMAFPVSAPRAVDDLARSGGLTARRVKTDGRSLVAAAAEKGTVLAGSMDGKFCFPVFQPNFDAMFSAAKVVEMLCRCELSLSAARQLAPRRPYRNIELPCSWELKGGMMRKMSEDAADQDASFIDGVKIHRGEDWALVLPDQHRSVIHIVAEAQTESLAESLLKEYRQKVEGWKKELQGE